MPTFYRHCEWQRFAALAAVALWLAVTVASAQSVGNSGSVNGTVVDPTGAVVPNARVEIRNPISGYDRSTNTDSAGKFALHEHSLQPLPPDSHGGRVYGLRAGCGTALFSAGQCFCESRGGWIDHRRNRGSGRRRPGGERSDVPHRCGQEPIRQVAAGKSIVFGELAGYAIDAGNHGRFERTLPRIGRPRGELVFGGWPTHYRSAEQDLLQPDSTRCDPVDGSDRGRTAGRIRRQNECDHQRHHPVRAGCDHTTRQCNGIVRFVRNQQRRLQSRLRRQELGQLCFGKRLE